MAEPLYTPYRVSTITANGHIGCSINQELFFNNVPIVSPSGDEKGFIWVEWGSNQTKGVYPKKRRKTERKIFDNQITVIYRLREGYMPNVKLFRNGNIQMTGIRTIEDGKYIVDKIADEIKNIIKTQNVKIVEDIDTIKARDFTIRMINSDFSVNYKIRRRELHRYLMDMHDNKCSYQPETYPGVKLQYFWNSKNKNIAGNCHCEKMCFGKGTGQELGSCKKVTISIFQSGKVLITGATSFEQVNDAYAYITKILSEQINKFQLQVPSFSGFSFF